MSKYIEAASRQYSFDGCDTPLKITIQLRKNIERFGYCNVPIEIVNLVNYDYAKFAAKNNLQFVVANYSVGFFKGQTELKFGEPIPQKKRKKNAH